MPPPPPTNHPPLLLADSNEEETRTIAVVFEEDPLWLKTDSSFSARLIPLLCSSTYGGWSHRRRKRNLFGGEN
ncbi:unnamed protein product [Linum trigynum]|uniref:Uncharacterized protein n=1 Tax=Linum trigynum TaxID=586398 RepID=A0AAV2DB99_9ROSI